VVDLYEMRWADISRFPEGLLRFLSTIYALLLQISTIGLEALRILRARGLRRAEWARVGLVAFSWTLALGVIGVTVAVLLETGAVLAAVALDDHPALGATVAIAIALTALGSAIWGAGRLRAGGWRVPAPAALGVAAAAVAHAAVRVADDGLRVGLGNALADLVAYPLRIAWLAASLAAVAAALLLAAMPWRRRPGRTVERDDEAEGAAVTGIVSLVVAPLGVAIVSAILFASFGALALEVADGHSWGSEVGELRCLEEPNSPTTTICAEVDGAGGAPAPTDWGLELFGRGLAPLVPTLAVAGVLLGLALLVAVLPFAIATLVARVERRRNARGASEREGELMSSALLTLSSPMAALLALVAIGVSAYAVGAIWIWEGALPGSLEAAQLGASVALVMSGLLVAVRVLGISPRRPFGRTTGWLERIRVVLDIPYDVATYLRVTQPGVVVAPRRRMLRRYRALLREIADGGVDREPYAGVVFVAHSQGTVLTAAALFGDQFRDPPEGPLAEETPGLELPPRRSLVTFGSPLRQLYGERFPGQFDWVRRRLDEPGGLAPLTDCWVNLYRSGDYVGRTLWAPDPHAPEVWDPGRLAYHRRLADGLEVVEHSLGPGSHTGYWAAPLLGEWVMHLIERAAGRPGPRPGPPS